MKYKGLTLAGALLILGAAPAIADDGYDVVKIDARQSQYDYRPNEVIVKFKDSSRAKVRPAASKSAAASGVSAVDEAFKALGVDRVEALMPLTGAETFPRKARSYSGREVEAPALSNAWLIGISAGHSVSEAVEMLSAIADVDYAEPNYLLHALATDEADDINDPYYSLQYGIADINLYKLWGQPVISKEGPVIAIIDTGVDIMHPDLMENIWTNPAEKEGATGYDDDRNGYTDDLHGWDFVNQTGVIADYNGHGTHCAGIAAAVGRNGLGIIGANPNARIMPLTALQSNGTGDVATIIKAVDYAAANGAQVISMSLGTYSHSMAFEQALMRAYHKSVIVAAAGNDGWCLNHAHPDKGQISPAPMFPAAYTFILGVQASAQGGSLAGFSNYDDNGPVFTAYGEEQLYNYELTAPGAGIMSTYPNGQYKRLNGTSMATPLVAGALSRLLQAKEYDNREELFGDLINTAKGGVLDIYAAYCITDKDRTPSLQIIGNRMADADGDGRADAGEVLEFYPTIRNGWGNASDIKLTIDCNETVNSFCEFLDTDADFGNALSSYGKGESANPLRLRINDNVVDGRICRLKLTASAPNAATVEQEFEITVENGVEIGGVIKEDMTLRAGVHYIVTSLLGVPEGVTLTIEPGAVIKFKPNTGLRVDGIAYAQGSIDSRIVFTMADNSQSSIGLSTIYFSNESILEFCEFNNLKLTNSNIGNRTVTGNFKNCIFCNNDIDFLADNSSSSFKNSNIYNNDFTYVGKCTNTNLILNNTYYSTSGIG